MEITLYYADKTRALRPRWLLEELNVPYRIRPVDIFGREGFSKAYRRIHPHGSVPALEVDGKVMIESGAICHWLSDRYRNKKLAPEINEPTRMDYEQWMYYTVATLEPMLWQIILHTSILPEKRRVPEIIPWAKKQLRPMLNYCNDAMRDREFLLGPDFSSADIMLGYLLNWSIDGIEDFPQLVNYTQRLQQRPAFIRAATPLPTNNESIK